MGLELEVAHLKPKQTSPANSTRTLSPRLAALPLLPPPPLAAAASPRPAASCDPFYAAAPSGDGGEARRAGALMVQASAAALRRLGRRHGGDPAAALLRCGVVPSSSSYSAPGTLLPLKQPVGDCGGCRRSFSSSAWLGPRLWRSLPRRQSAAAAATATAWEAHHSTRKSSMATVSSEPDTSASQSEILHFIKSTFGTLEGQNHCWLNCMNDTWKTLNQGVYLILLYESCGTSDSHGKLSSAFQRLKYLQQRYPRLTVFAMEYGSDISSLQSQTVHTVMKEYFTFPILMSDKDFTHITNGACCLLFEGSKDHALFSNLDEELEVLIKGMDNAVLKAEPSDTALESRVSWQKEEVPKEPYVGSIGCSPGFEDGEFESAKFLRPAASFYNTAEDCLYIVDSENHAVRKADLGRRMLETVYPVSSKSSCGIWSWIVDKLGLRREDAPSENFIADSIAFPWHLLNITEDDFLVADRNFETSWILSVSTGQKQEIGRAEEMESYQQIIHERCALLKDMNMNWSSSAKEHSDLLGKIPFKELVSSVARFQKYIIFCDADGQRVLKHDLDTNGTSNIQFSNFGVLGLPYWFVCHLERVSTRGHSIGKFQEHTRKVNVLPGRCNIKVSVDIPADTQLAAPLVESCIWRQVRGSGAEVSGFDEPSTSTEKLVASAALYLKIDSAKDDHGEQQALVKRIIQCQRREDHAGVELLMESCKDARDLTIMKPVHLRLMLECADHPAGTTNKETISSESSFEINISLD
uniref:Thioredoxin-like fold domain-containing protein n=1 Tax=Oryza meridionalis TaxID=40149 RepID=A0A0E0EHL0_9ORYZ